MTPLMVLLAVGLSDEQVLPLEALRRRIEAGEVSEETHDYCRLLFGRRLVEAHVLSEGPCSSG